MASIYFGITGATTEEQVKTILKVMPANPNHKLMLGILVSDKTMVGIPGTPRYADLKDIFKIFSEDPRVLNFIHFNIHDQRNLLLDITTLATIYRERLHGFQLNMRWPDWVVIERFKEKFPDKKIVIQMERKDFEQYYIPKKMAEKLMIYNKTVEYVILDMSMGEGRKMNPEKILPYARAISKTSNLNIVFAGGLCAENLDMLIPIKKEFPNMSIDAEGQLMNAFGALDINKARSYVKKAFELLD
jgi:hypothetical protein